MALVKVVALQEVETPFGDKMKPGESFCLEAHEVKKYTEGGFACLYSNFPPPGYKKKSKESRIVAAPENAATITKAPEGIETRAN